MTSLDLPRPISTNALTRPVGNRQLESREYRAWKKEASAMLMAQSPLPRFDGRVRLTYAVGTEGVSGNFDLGNAEKALTDALVAAGVIVDDRRKYVQGIGLEWVKGKDGCTVYIEGVE